MSRNHLIKIESGNTDLSAYALTLLAECLNCSMDELCRGLLKKRGVERIDSRPGRPAKKPAAGNRRE
jgi:transcriptional regulator with XRE-family HTH domain